MRGLALAASLLLFQSSALADPGNLEVSHGSSTICQLATPAPSGWADTESSINVAVTNWPGLGRHIYLTLSAMATPSNNVQITFGKDADADGDLAPEETQVTLGFDCGEWFVRDERCKPSRPFVVDDWIDTESYNPTNVARTIHLRQVSKLSDRFDFAKVTTRGRGNSAAEIAAEIKRFGVLLFLR